MMLTFIPVSGLGKGRSSSGVSKLLLPFIIAGDGGCVGEQSEGEEALWKGEWRGEGR